MTYFYRAYNFFKALLVASGKGFDRLRHHAKDFFLGSREGRRVDTKYGLLVELRTEYALGCCTRELFQKQ